MSERFKAASQQHNEEMQSLHQESELISKYQPTLIGLGNDHYVYEAEGHPDSVIKINRESIKYALKYCLEDHGTMDEYTSDTRVHQEIDKWIQYFKQRQHEMREYFGKEHCAASRYVKIKIPTIPSFYKEMPAADVTKIPEELLVVATVQERLIENFTEDDSVHTWYIKDDLDAYAYSDYTTSALTDPYGPLARPKRPDLTNEETRTVIRDFVEKAITYTDETGHILDLNGVNNLVLTHEQDGTLSYKLLDALFPATNWSNVITEVKGILEKHTASPDTELLPVHKSKVKLVVNYIRFINELAGASGSTERIDTLTTTNEESVATLRRVLASIYSESKSNQNLTQK